jgi:Spy/CpxP family protein refolding chaperone
MRTYVLRFAAAVGLAFALVAASAVAQPPGGPGGPGGQRGPGMFMMGGGMMGYAQLLRIEKVQKEIELTDDQKAELQKIEEQSRARMRELFQGGGQDREAARQRFEQARQETEKAIEGVLLPNQVKRLKEIRLQVVGIAGALMDQGVRKELGVTEEQAQKIREAVQKVMEDMRGQRQQGERPSAEQMQQRMQEMRTKMAEAVMAQLTEEQKNKWNQMIGEKFEISPSEMFGGFRGPQGGPGGPQGGPGRPGRGNRGA